MDLLHFDTENRKAIVQMTRTELQDLDSDFLAKNLSTASREVRGEHGSLEIRVVGD